MKNDFTFLTEEPEIDIFWNELEPGVYKVILLDILNPKNSYFANNNCYLCYKCRIIEGDINTDKHFSHMMHFPIRCFKYAWKRYPGFTKIDTNKNYDCIIEFEKFDMKKMKITNREYIERSGG